MKSREESQQGEPAQPTPEVPLEPAEVTAKVPALQPEGDEAAPLGESADTPTLVDLKLRRQDDPADTADEDDGAA